MSTGEPAAESVKTSTSQHPGMVRVYTNWTASGDHPPDHADSSVPLTLVASPLPEAVHAADLNLEVPGTGKYSVNSNAPPAEISGRVKLSTTPGSGARKNA